MLKKIVIGCWIALFSFSYAKAEFFYPIQEMSKPECRFQDFWTLWSDCKQTLPILKTSDYSKYKSDYGVFRRVYTVLWWASYKYGWDVWYGWHSWVDIATAKGTPVYSMTSWKVVFAGNLSWRGNTVKIEHTHNGRKIYSNYSHMSAIHVQTWDQVWAKQKIWEVWSTGNSTGNHLHFQIDLAVSGKWPRYRSNCRETNYDTIINSGVCFDQLAINTVDPLRFLETNGSIVTGWWVIEKPQSKPADLNPVNVLSREEIERMEIQEFFKNFEIKIQVSWIWWNLTLGKAWTVRISVTDKRTRRPYNGSFPWEMNFKYSKNAFDIFPTGIFQIDNGVRDFKITPKMEGKQTLDIYIGETFLRKLQFGVFDTKKSIIPAAAVFWIKRNAPISQNTKWILYFKNNYGLNILWFPFSGNYTLTSPSKNIKFCVKKARTITELQRQSNASCKEESFQFEQTIRWIDASIGIVLFEFKVMNQGVNTIKIMSESNAKELSTFRVNGTTPLWLQVTHPYYEEIMHLAWYGMISWMSNGFVLQDRELTAEDGVNFIRNYLEYRMIWCWVDITCKSSISSLIIELSKQDNSRFTYLSRIDFVEMLYTFTKPWVFAGNSMDFRDLNTQQKIFSRDVLRSNTWKDVFWETRYFQPNKNITRWEAMFLISHLLSL